jgi:hypothetical protein
MSQPSRRDHSQGVDPNTYAYVAATAFFTAITFTIAVLNILGFALQHYLG